MSTVSERIIKIIAEQLNKETSEIKLEDSFLEDLGADSLDVVELSILIKDEFNIKIRDDIMDFRTVGDVVSFVEEKVASASK